jgi:antitoxin (DNA-binding transcriptional repressor) of toxin-antitoxin stability system
VAGGERGEGMKKLNEYLKKLAAVEMITATELRANLGECLTLVDHGVALGIQRKGKTVAWLVNARDTDITHHFGPNGECKSLGPKLKETTSHG